MIEIGLILLFLVLFIIDWMQTLTIAKNPDKYEEQFNPFLKGHPSVKKVNTFFFILLVILASVAALLPGDWGIKLLFGWVVIEAAMVVNNYMEGIKP